MKLIIKFILFYEISPDRIYCEFFTSNHTSIKQNCEHQAFIIKIKCAKGKQRVKKKLEEERANGKIKEKKFHCCGF